MAVVVAWQWWRGPLRVEMSAVEPDPASIAGPRLAELPQLEEMPALETFAGVVERPLFDQTRRPPPPEPVEEQVAAAEPARVLEPPPALRLAGVVIVGGDRVAVVQGPGAQPVRRLQAGVEVEGWTVDDIQPRAIRLRQGEREAVIDLPRPPMPEGISVLSRDTQ